MNPEQTHPSDDESTENRDASLDENDEQNGFGWIGEPDRLDTENPYRIAVPVLEGVEERDTERLMRTAETIASDRNGELLILCMVTVPEQTPLDLVESDGELIDDARATAEQLIQAAATTGVSADGVVCVTHREVTSVLQMVEKYACDGVLINISDSSQRRRLLTGDTVEKVTARAGCDVFVQKFGERSTPAQRVFVPVSGGPHSGLATETARALARANDAHVDIVHFLSDDASNDQREEGEQMLEGAVHILKDVGRVGTSLVETDDVAEEIIGRSEDYDVTVFGAPTMGLLEQFVYGTVRIQYSRKPTTRC